MADRYGFQFTKTLVPETFLLDGYLTVGVSGAVTSASLPIWMASITRNSTGNYTVVLTDLWTSLTSVQVDTLADNDPTDVTICKVVSKTPGSVSGTTTTAAQFVFQVTSGGSAADPQNNGALMFDLNVKNSNSL